MVLSLRTYDYADGRRGHGRKKKMLIFLNAVGWRQTILIEDLNSKSQMWNSRTSNTNGRRPDRYMESKIDDAAM